jgi:hypothetical protein
MGPYSRGGNCRDAAKIGQNRRSTLQDFDAGAGPDGHRAGRSVVATAVVHADHMVEGRAKFSDYVGKDGCLVEDGDDDPATVIARDGIRRSRGGHKSAERIGVNYCGVRALVCFGRPQRNGRQKS